MKPGTIVSIKWQGYTIECDKQEYIIRTPEGYKMYELSKLRNTTQDCMDLIKSAIAFKAA